MLEKFINDLAKFEVVRNDFNFRTLLQVNEKIKEDNARKEKFQSNSISLLRLAKKNA